MAVRMALIGGHARLSDGEQRNERGDQVDSGVYGLRQDGHRPDEEPNTDLEQDESGVRSDRQDGYAFLRRATSLDPGARATDEGATAAGAAGETWPAFAPAAGILPISLNSTIIASRHKKAPRDHQRPAELLHLLLGHEARLHLVLYLTSAGCLFGTSITYCILPPRMELPH